MHALNLLLDISRRFVIGHRGASAHAPENTMPAFQLALELGAEALELDVHLSADGVPVVIHDATLDRTTDLAGPVAARTAAQLQGADAGFRCTAAGPGAQPWRGRGARVPLLAEVLEAYAHLPLIVEIKDPKAQSAVARLLRDQRATDRCVVAAEDPSAVLAFHDAPFLRGASTPEIARLWAGSFIGLLPRRVTHRMFSVPERHRGLRIVTRRFLSAARRLGVPVHVWTVNDVADAERLWRAGVCGIITDDPAAMRGALNRIGG